MNPKERIDKIATVARTILENVPLDQSDKILGHSIIDFTAEALKLQETLQNGKLEFIRQAASSCGLNRLVAFPYEKNGQVLCLLRISGGNQTTFCNMTNIMLISNQRALGSSTEIDDAERNYGVVLYERT